MTLYRENIAFVSSGLHGNCTAAACDDSEAGKILIADTRGRRPIVQAALLTNGVPTGFRPHGIFLHNASNRLFAISHNTIDEEESIVVFDVIANETVPAALPSLSFRFQLTSNAFPWLPTRCGWLLSDLVVVDSVELLATQWGPRYDGNSTQCPEANNMTDTYPLWRCRWSSALVSEGAAGVRIPALCSPIRWPGPNVGNGGNLNGIALSGADRSRPFVWVNELNARRLWRVHRGGHGVWSGTSYSFLQLPHWVDNVELDDASNELTMGLIDNRPDDGYGGEVSAAVAHDSALGYAEPQVVMRGQVRGYVTSSAVATGRYRILGSAVATGLQICEMPEVMSTPEDPEQGSGDLEREGRRREAAGRGALMPE